MSISRVLVDAESPKTVLRSVARMQWVPRCPTSGSDILACIRHDHTKDIDEWNDRRRRLGLLKTKHAMQRGREPRQEAQALADAVLENRWNPKGLRRNHRGELLDKWGRVMDIDWDEFDKKRMGAQEKYPKWPKVLNPLHAAATPKR